MQINIRDLKQLELRVPPLITQNALADRLEAAEGCAEQLQANYSAKLDALIALKQSLLHRAFTGELASRAAPATNDNWKAPAFTAHVIALAYRRHVSSGTEATFGRVKAQKALHLCESVGGIDLGRVPIKDAAGPNDFQHMLAAEDWAKANQFFEFAPRPSGNGYSFKKLGNFNAMMTDALASTRLVAAALERAIDPIVQMVSQDAEVFATVHAAWNNLLHDGNTASDDAIVKEARDNWHVAKLKIPEAKFRAAIKSIRTKGLVPDGTAKYVGGQSELF